MKKESNCKKQREAVFHSEFREDLRFWAETNRKTLLRAFDLIEAILREPFNGIGKPRTFEISRVGLVVAAFDSGTPHRLLRQRNAD